MGLLNRSDSKIYRHFFNEAVKLLGQRVAYQYVINQELTIHSEDNSNLSAPIPLDIIFEENPTIDTLNRLGWISEMNDQRPIVIYLPYTTPKLSVNARITIETVDGTPRPRTFKVTKIGSDLEFPDAYACSIVPVFDQYEQTNQYSITNYEKINTEESKVTSEDQPYKFIQSTDKEDTTPKQYKDWQEDYSFISDEKSPFSS